VLWLRSSARCAAPGLLWPLAWRTRLPAARQTASREQVEATPQGVPPRAQLLAALRRHAVVDARVDARVCCGQWRCYALAPKALPTALLLLRRRSSRASQGTLLWLPVCAGSGGAATRAVLRAFLSWRELTAPTGARDCRSLVPAHGFYSLTTSPNGTCTAKRTRCRAASCRWKACSPDIRRAPRCLPRCFACVSRLAFLAGVPSGALHSGR